MSPVQRYLFFPAAVLGFFLLLAMEASAMQQDTVHGNGLSLRIEGPAAVASGGEVIGMTLAMANAHADSLYGQLQLSVSSGLSLLGSASPPIRIEGEGKLFLPVKMQVAADAPAGQHELVVRAYSDEGELLAVASSVVDVQAKRAVWLQPLSTQEFMRHIGDSVTIRMAVRNNGNTREQIKIVASYPGVSGSRRFASMSFPLAGAADTTVSFGFIVDRQLMSQEHFAVHLTGLYANDDVFGNASVSVQNAASNRRFADLSAQLGAYQPNRVSLTARNPGMPTQSWQLDGMGSYAIGNGEFNFNVFAYQWGNLEHKPVLNNTWAEYQNERTAVTVGNISENLETFLYGRGAKVRLSGESQSEHIEFGVAERTFDLLGSDFGTDFHNGFTAFFRTRLGEGLPDRKRYTGTAVYEYSPRENSESMLYMSSFDLVPQAKRERMQLVAEFGPALTRPLRDAGNMDYKPSFATGLQLHTQVSGFAVSSTNYYSTGYYPGTRRGALQLNQRISRAFSRTNTWAGYSLYEYAPRYFESQPFLQNRFLVSRAEIGTSFPVNDFASLSLSPLHEHERGQYAFGGPDAGNRQIRLHAYRLSAGLNWRARNYKQYGYLTLESGLLQSSLAETAQWQGRLNLSYSYDWFNFNANVQRGSFSLVELANNWYFQRDEVFRIGVSTFARKEFFSKKLQADAGLGYYRDSFSGENWTATGRVQYAFSRKTSLFVLGQFYRYGNVYYRSLYNANFQLGVQQALPGRNALSAPKKGNIELAVYYDNNHNGLHDAGDTPAANTTVLIDNTVFITDKDGKVQYRGVPYGPHRVSVPVQQGWYTNATNLNVDSRRTAADVLLQQAGTVTGTVRFEFDERISYEVNTALGGYTITATGTNGFVARTMTDNAGNYTLFLPAGDYEISILESSMPQHVYPESPVGMLGISPNTRNEGPVFVLKAAQRKVEIKRFTSP